MFEKRWTSAAVALALGTLTGTASAGWVMIEDWEDFDVNQEPHVTGNVWTRNSANDSHGRITTDPAGGTDQVLKLTSGFNGRGYYTNLGSNALPAGAISTLFFRFYADGATVGARLTDLNAFSTAWYNEDRAGAAINDTFTFAGDEIEQAQWYNAWFVVDLASTTKTYDIYLSQGSSAGSLWREDLAIQKTSDSSSVGGTLGALDTFLLHLGNPSSSGKSTYIGDILVDTSGQNVTNPVPEPSMLGMVALAGVLGLRRRR